MEREAAIPRPMPMSTFEASAGVTEHQRARRQQGIPGSAAIAERARDHHRNAHAAVLLFEWMVAWAVRAQHVGDRPAVAPGKRAREHTASRAFERALRERLLQICGDVPHDDTSSRSVLCL
jgi:hypothetical protein